jgi:hypothetical protein
MVVAHRGRRQRACGSETTARPSAHASLSHFMKRLRVRTDPLFPAVRTTYRGSVVRSSWVVLVIFTAVRAMVQYILVMVAALALVHLLWR